MCHLSPAACVVRLFGGVRRAARRIGRSPGAVSQWQKSGNVPAEIQRALLVKAKSGEIEITAEELILGTDTETAEAEAGEPLRPR